MLGARTYPPHPSHPRDPRQTTAPTPHPQPRLGSSPPATLPAPASCFRPLVTPAHRSIGPAGSLAAGRRERRAASRTRHKHTSARAPAAAARCCHVAPAPIASARVPVLLTPRVGPTASRPLAHDRGGRTRGYLPALPLPFPLQGLGTSWSRGDVPVIYLPLARRRARRRARMAIAALGARTVDRYYHMATSGTILTPRIIEALSVASEIKNIMIK